MNDKSFTKRYFAYLIIVEFIVIIFICIMSFVTGDSGPTHWVITVLGAEVSAYSAFYLTKSKYENRHKYAQAYVADIAEKYGIESAIKMAEVVLKD